MASGRSGRFGLPLFEVCVVIVVAGLVLGLLAERISVLLEQAERAAMELTVTHLRSGLRLEKARRMLASEPMSTLAGSDPLRWVDADPPHLPSNYLLDLLKLTKSGRWLFDTASRELIYRPVRLRHLKLETGEDDKRLAWRIEMKAGQAEPELRLLTPYRWF